MSRFYGTQEGKDMMNYLDSKYYERISALSDQIGTTSAEFWAKANEVLDEELDGPESEWLAEHFDSAIGCILDSVAEGEVCEDEIEEMVKGARQEIRIFRKHGLHSKADEMELALTEMLQMIAGG